MNIQKKFTYPTFFKTGHRGCRGLYPENSLEGFIAAIDLGVNAIEFDLVVSKDKKLIVSHEPYMNPEICLKPDGTIIPSSDSFTYNLYEMNYEEIKNFDCGLKENPRFPRQKKTSAYKPTLQETIDKLEAYILKNSLPPILYDIEIKSEEKEYNRSQPEPEVFAEMLLAFILDNNLSEKVLVRSFDPKPLQYIHLNKPELKLALIVENKLSAESNLKNLGFNPFIYSPEFILLSKEEMHFLKQENLKVVPWTVNSPQDIQKMISLEVDGIITDYPDLFKSMAL